MIQFQTTFASDHAIVLARTFVPANNTIRQRCRRHRCGRQRRRTRQRTLTQSRWWIVGCFCRRWSVPVLVLFWFYRSPIAFLSWGFAELMVRWLVMLTSCWIRGVEVAGITWSEDGGWVTIREWGMGEEVRVAVDVVRCARFIVPTGKHLKFNFINGNIGLYEMYKLIICLSRINKYLRISIIDLTSLYINKLSKPREQNKSISYYGARR